MTRLWLKDAAAGACLAVFITCCACLPLDAPFGISDFFNHPGLVRHHQKSVTPCIRSMPPNLLVEYLCEFVDGASDITRETMIVALHAQSKMPAAETA